MSPRLKHGQIVFGYKCFRKQKLKPNDIVVFNHPEFGVCIKQIKSINSKDKTVTVSGENELSTSTEKIGPVAFKNITNKIIF